MWFELNVVFSNAGECAVYLIGFNCISNTNLTTTGHVIYQHVSTGGSHTW